MPLSFLTAFLNAVNSLNLLLFTKLFAVFGNFLACRRQTVCAGSYGSFFKRALAVVTFIAFQKQLSALTSTQAAFSFSVSCHNFLTPPYTLRRLGGLQPLWGMGDTSEIKVISTSHAPIALMADSLPAPGPLT